MATDTTFEDFATIVCEDKVNLHEIQVVGWSVCLSVGLSVIS